MGGVLEVSMHPANPNAGLPSQNVLGHLLGVLDDDEHQGVEERLERDPEYAQALAYWRRQLTSLEMLRPDYEPPPGLAERACRRVAAHKTTSALRSKGMNPVVSPPSWIATTRWLDVSVAALLFVAAAAVIFPAIYRGRLHAHVATCQDGLRQFGLAVAQRSRLHGEALSDAAGSEHLVPVGRAASTMLPAGFPMRLPGAFPADAEAVVQNALRTRSPQADVLRQGVLRTVALSAIPGQDQRPAARRVVYLSGPMLPESPSLVDAWTDNAAVAPCAGLPESSDALAAISNWVVDHRSGQGWNALFEDGHVDFLSHALPQEVAWLFFQDAPFFVGSVLEPLSK